jgi:hypothetical protein
MTKKKCECEYCHRAIYLLDKIDSKIFEEINVMCKSCGAVFRKKNTEEERIKREDNLIGNPDAKVWAEEFVKLLKEKSNIEIDEGLMIGWFANAIMAGYDKGHRDAESKTQGGQNESLD